MRKLKENFFKAHKHYNFFQRNKLTKYIYSKLNKKSLYSINIK